jgi:transposase
MRGIPEATEITLTVEKREQLGALVRSAKCEARMRFRAWIVLLAAAGTGTREISRRLRCTIATASKWRVRYARKRLVGLSETGDRGAEAKYGTEHQQRILAMLDRPPPAGCANWTLISACGRDKWRTPYDRQSRIQASGPMFFAVTTQSVSCCLSSSTGSAAGLAARRSCPYRRGVAGPARADGCTTCTRPAHRHSASAASIAVSADRWMRMVRNRGAVVTYSPV